jgi:hypothetical protein
MAEKKPIKIPWLLVGASLLAFALCVPVIANVIREIEPGRQKSPESMALDSGPQIPERGPVITAHCPEPCRLGTYVKLIAGRTDKPSWVAVYAEDAAHHRVWYFPDPAGDMPQVAVRNDVGVLSEAVKLSDEHKSEKAWTLHLLLVDQKMTRAELLAPAQEHVIVATELHLVLGEGK